MSWLKTALIWAILAIAAIAAHHHFIKVPAQKRAQERARVAALESKVSANFENYLRAAPLLKGEVGDAFVSELNDRIYGLGYMPNDPRYQGMTPAQKWKAVSADRAAA